MNGFPKDGRMILGINYWASGNAINMWSGWDPRAVEEDFKVMKDAGIECLRVFPLWPVFQPLSAIRSHDGVIEYRFGEEPLPGTEAGRWSGVPLPSPSRQLKFYSYGFAFIYSLIERLHLLNTR